MLALAADLYLCALMSLRSYVPSLLCLRPYVGIRLTFMLKLTFLLHRSAASNMTFMLKLTFMLLKSAASNMTWNAIQYANKTARKTINAYKSVITICLFNYSHLSEFKQKEKDKCRTITNNMVNCYIQIIA